MRIANPIYDAVFKYLLEDNDIARDLIALIIGEEIVSLEVKSQETATQIPAGGLTVLRYDFKAIIQKPDGGFKKVLIELQKAKHLLDIMRFRRYLGENYRKADEYQENGQAKTAPLDIVTIYFLGFRLENVPYAMLKSNNCYQDMLTGQFLKEKVEEPFVNLLDHEGIFIQIPRLEPHLQTRLEKVLFVFSQKNKTDDIHELDYKGQTDDPLIVRIVHRLQFALADEEVQRQMEAEEEVGNILQEMERKMEAKDRMLEEKEQRLTSILRKLQEMGIDPDEI